MWVVFVAVVAAARTEKFEFVVVAVWVAVRMEFVIASVLLVARSETVADFVRTEGFVAADFVFVVNRDFGAAYSEGADVVGEFGSPVHVAGCVVFVVCVVVAVVVDVNSEVDVDEVERREVTVALHAYVEVVAAAATYVVEFVAVKVAVVVVERVVVSAVVWAGEAEFVVAVAVATDDAATTALTQQPAVDSEVLVADHEGTTSVAEKTVRLDVAS